MQAIRHTQCVAMAMAAGFFFLMTPGQTAARAQAQPGSNSEPDRAALVQVKPDIVGLRNGKFIEPDPMDFANHTGFTSIFDDKTVNGWDGRPGVWSVEDGAIVGVSTLEHNAGNTFLVHHGTEAKDFDLKLEIKAE